MTAREKRETIYLKYKGHCAYCGEHIGDIKKMQVDHIRPQYHYEYVHQLANLSKPKHGKDDMENLNPACAVCNRRKDTHSISQFREEIEAQLDRLYKYSSQYRLALKYGLIEEKRKPVVFHFEKQ